MMIFDLGNPRWNLARRRQCDQHSSPAKFSANLLEGPHTTDIEIEKVYQSAMNMTFNRMRYVNVLLVKLASSALCSFMASIESPEDAIRSSRSVFLLFRRLRSRRMLLVKPVSSSSSKLPRWTESISCSSLSVMLLSELSECWLCGDCEELMTCRNCDSRRVCCVEPVRRWLAVFGVLDGVYDISVPLCTLCSEVIAISQSGLRSKKLTIKSCNTLVPHLRCSWKLCIAEKKTV